MARSVASRPGRSMPASTFTAAFAVALLARVCASSVIDYDVPRCETAARTEAGWVCGARLRDSSGAPYASFKGVPYAKQPLGELRFQELQPPEPWKGVLNATTEGPICLQYDVFYGNVMKPQGMSEACIHANIHVPLDAMPRAGDHHKARSSKGLPILVFIHGGGFMFGSGDGDLHGPEYLVSKGVIVITFNYRLNVFGFLSLNSRSIPGNNGIRDVISLLYWVQRNAAAFGGDPDAVTVAGQSAGAAIAHLVTLSPPAQGLFQQAVVLSGVGFTEFFSSSPLYAKTVANMFLAKVGIDTNLDPEEIHKILIKTPLETIMGANKELINLFGLIVFTPVVESPHPGVTAVLDDDPEILQDSGRGRHVPLMIGFTDAECESFRPRFEQIDMAARIQASPLIAVPARMIYRSPEETIPSLIKLIHNKYFNVTVDVDSFINLCTDAYYKYPALKLASKRIGTGASTFLYRFSYGGRHSALKEAWGLKFAGAGHVEDITYFFRVNSVLGAVVDGELSEVSDDSKVKHQMTDFIVNFMRYSEPMPGSCQWSPVQHPLQYQSIAGPHHTQHTTPTAHELDLVEFYDGLNKIVSTRY